MFVDHRFRSGRLARMFSQGLILALLARGAMAAEPINTDTEADHWSRIADKARKAGDCKGAALALERAMADTTLTDPSSLEKFAHRYREARRCQQESLLAIDERRLRDRDYLGQLRFRAIEDPQLRNREFRLLEAVADSFVQAGRSHDVLAFLRYSGCPDPPGVEFRGRLWARLREKLWPALSIEPTPREFFACVALGDSLRASAPALASTDSILARVRKRARGFHEQRARENARYPGSAHLHYALANLYGASSSFGWGLVHNALCESTLVDWHLESDPRGRGTPVEVLTDLKRSLGAHDGSEVRVFLDLQECGPGLLHWTKTEKYAVNGTMRQGATVFTPAWANYDPETGQVSYSPAESHYETSTQETVVMRERIADVTSPSYLIRGTARLVLGRASQEVRIDVHPVDNPEGRTTGLRNLAVSELADVLRGALPRLRTGQSEQLLARARDAIAAGRMPEAEHCYALSILYLGYVPIPARAYFREHYGLLPSDVMWLLHRSP